MNKEMRSSGFRQSWIAVAAAAILVVGTGSFIALSTNSSNSTDQFAGSSYEIPDLKPVDFLTSIPFERSEQYVMISVDAQRVKEVDAELESFLGAPASVVGSNSKVTTFVVPTSVANQLTNPSGLTVIADTPMKTIAEQTPVPSWGLDRIDAVDTALNNSYKYVSTGAGALVYVIDTGVYSAHSDLSGRVISGYTAIADGNGTQDCNGHGTHVAGTVGGKTFGVAKTATIVAVRVLDCAGSGFSSSVVAGINWAVASHPGGPGIINLSLGGSANTAVDSAVAAATQAGLVVVVAAGNSGADACQFSPARAPSAITIGATDQSDSRASYSNFGGCVDMYAPGSGITSAWISGTTASRTISGTSMAAPHVAGLAARLTQSQPGISSSGISEALTAKNVEGTTLTIANFVEAETPETPPTTTPPDTSVPPEEVAPTTTTVPRNSKSPGNTKAPGQNKKVVTPKEFKVAYQTVDAATTLVATWQDDRTPESYAIECTPGAPTPTSIATTRFIVEQSATTLSTEGLVQATLNLSPTESMFCWVVAFIGPDNSARSNVARVNVAPRPTTPSAPRPTTPSAPSPTTPGPGNTSNPGRSPNNNKSDNSPAVNNPGSTAPTTIAPEKTSGNNNPGKKK